MKKKFLVLLAVFALLLVGCGAEDDVKKQYTEEDLIGKYEDYSYRDSQGVYFDFLIGPTTKTALIIEESDSGLVFTDTDFKGTCSLSEDGIVTLYREAVISEDVALQNAAKMMMEQFPFESYILYKDYLISTVPLMIDEIDGALPNGEYTYCSLDLAHISLTNYFLTFFEDGTCEIESTGVTGTSSEYFAGSYTFDGKIILMTFTEGDLDGMELSGTCKMALYIDDENVYYSIYKKTK